MIIFWKSSATVSVSTNFTKDSSTLQDTGHFSALQLTFFWRKKLTGVYENFRCVFLDKKVSSKFRKSSWSGLLIPRVRIRIRSRPNQPWRVLRSASALIIVIWFYYNDAAYTYSNYVVTFVVSGGSGGATPRRARSNDPAGRHWLRPVYCFASVIVWRENIHLYSP